MILRLDKGHGLWSAGPSGYSAALLVPTLLISERGLISSTEPADDTALQNSQRRERRLQHVPYLWAALTRGLIRGERLRVKWCSLSDGKWPTPAPSGREAVYAPSSIRRNRSGSLAMSMLLSWPSLTSLVTVTTVCPPSGAD
jgi:hypothetical protein